MNKWIKAAIVAIVFIICMVLVVIGQKNIGATGMIMMFVGLAGLLILMFLYNRKYQ